MGKLDGRVAVITGGASGFGEASGRLFVGEGASLVIADINDERGKSLADELGTAASYIHANVTQEAEVKAAVDHAVDKFGRLDIIFNNAGITGGAIGGIDEIDLETFDITLAVHLRGVMLGMKHAVPVMKKQGSGSIINMGSMSGLRTGWGPHAYSAAKAAIIHLTKTVAMELGPNNIRANSICPTWISTPLFGNALGLSEEDSEKLRDRLTEEFKKLHPIPYECTADDVAKLALFLASDDSSFISGQALAIDGAAGCGRSLATFMDETIVPALSAVMES
jgi:NAD(P)-dependent dehydrogenase (short-subunit alcohol dehydrogenase family)